MYNRIITDLSNQEYHANKEAVSNSQLSRIARSPALFNAPFKTTPSLRWGTLVHGIVLEPGAFGELAAVMPDGLDKGKGSTARVEEFESKNAGKIVVSATEYRQLLDIRKTVFDDADAGELLTAPGRTEHSLFWEDEVTGVKCRCRPDFWRDDGIVVDLKTTADNSEHGFSRSALDYRYFSQAAFYWDGIKAVTGKAPDAFIFIAIEGKDDPAIFIETYNVEDEELDFGRACYRKTLETYKQCKAAGAWPKKLAHGIKRLRLPRWAEVG